MDDIIIFLHIQKTGGTSVRKSLKDFFNDYHISFYFDKNKKMLANNKLYLSNDWRLAIDEIIIEKIHQCKVKSISGHFTDKWLNYIINACSGKCNFFIFTLIRNPVDRIFSSYFYLKENNSNLIKNNNGDFFSIDYLIKNDIALGNNYQINTINNIKQPINFIGITEYHSQSVEKLNKILNIDLQNHRLNTLSYIEPLSIETKKLIEQYNKEDIDFYNLTLQKFYEDNCQYKARKFS